MQNRIYICIILILLTAAAGVVLWGGVDNQSPAISADTPATTSSARDTAVAAFGTTTLQLALANTPKERHRGLSRRSRLPYDGMLFVFGKEDLHGFWMKDMQFPIDMIWLDKNGKVVGVQASASPASYPQTFYPDQPALYVIETRTGFVQERKIDIGHTIDISGMK
jgi:uncharacterized membrane protein (UPF0127 family)